ncbi:hypothetical protein D3C87_1294780 [compost metagenome]
MAQKDLGQLPWRFRLWQVSLELLGLRLDPALAFQLLRLGLQRRDGTRQITGFILQIGMGNRPVQSAGGQLVNGGANPVKGQANRTADQPAHQPRQCQATEQ